MGRFLIHIDAQDAQDFFRRRLACVPGHPQIRDHCPRASRAAASRPDYPVHRCSIYSPSRWICPVAGGGRPARRQTGVSQRGQAGFQRSRPPDTPHLTIGTTPPGARASRPHAVPSVAAQFPCDVAADRPAGGNRMGPAEAEAGRRCRLIPVEETGCGRICAGGTPALPGGLPPMTGSHQRDKSAEAFWRQLSLKGPSVGTDERKLEGGCHHGNRGPIGVAWNDPHGRAGVRLTGGPLSSPSPRGRLPCKPLWVYKFNETSFNGETNPARKGTETRGRLPPWK